MQDFLCESSLHSWLKYFTGAASDTKTSSWQSRNNLNIKELKVKMTSNEMFDKNIDQTLSG